MMRSLFVFLLGAATDALWCIWMHATATDRPIRGALVSMVLGAAGIFGMSEALSSKRRAGALILGYGAGTLLATYLLGVK